MLKNYILGTEIAKVGNFHIANISMLLKNNNLIEGIDYLKFGGITLLNKQSIRYPNYIIKAIYDTIHSSRFTDLSDLIPITYFNEMLENNKRLIQKSYEVVVVDGKKFVRIKDAKLKDVLFDDTKVKSVVNRQEIEGLLSDKLISGYINLSNSKTLVWY